MSDISQHWCLIVETLASLERARNFDHPRIVLLDLTPRDQATYEILQATIMADMIARMMHSTHHYKSAHYAPLNWGVRVDRGQVLGLAFVELSLQIPDRGMHHRTNIRVVTSLKHPGWTLEASGRMDLWRAGWDIFKQHHPEEPRPHYAINARSFVELPNAEVISTIKALVSEADRVHTLFQRLRSSY